MHKHALALVLALAALALAGCPASKPADGTAADTPLAQGQPPAARTQTPAPATEIPQPSAANVKPAQDFEYTMFDGTPHKLSDNFGKPTVVNFWADWCPPCVGELPHFEEAWQAKGGQFNLVAIAVSSAKDPRGYVAEQGYTMPFAVDGNGASTYSVTGIPVTLFIDRDGNVVEQVVGGMDKATFETNLAKIL